MEATYRHRYEIAATPGGSKVSYSVTQLTMSNPLLRLGLPVVRNMSWQLGIPFMAARGVRDLLANAETRATSDRLFSQQARRACAIRRPGNCTKRESPPLSCTSAQFI